MSSDKEYPTDPFAPSIASIEFVDGAGKLLEGLHYNMKLPDGTSKESSTGSDGVVIIPSGAEGQVEVTILSQ